MKKKIISFAVFLIAFGMVFSAIPVLNGSIDVNAGIK